MGTRRRTSRTRTLAEFKNLPRLAATDGALGARYPSNYEEPGAPALGRRLPGALVLRELLHGSLSTTASRFVRLSLHRHEQRRPLRS